MLKLLQSMAFSILVGEQISNYFCILTSCPKMPVESPLITYDNQIPNRLCMMPASHLLTPL